MMKELEVCPACGWYAHTRFRNTPCNPALGALVLNRPWTTRSRGSNLESEAVEFRGAWQRSSTEFRLRLDVTRA